MALVRTDYGLIYNTDGSLCATLLPEGGVAVTEGTTNLHTKAFASSWYGISSPNATVEDIEVDGFTWAKRYSSDGQLSGNIYNIVSIPCNPSQTYTFSVWVRRVSGSITDECFMYLRTDADTNDIARLNLNNDMLPIGQWRRFSITGTTQATATQFIRSSFAVSKVNAVVLEIADWQLEAKPFATPFVEGTRPAGALSYDLSNKININGNWTIAKWVELEPYYMDKSFAGTNAINKFRLPLIELGQTYYTVGHGVLGVYGAWGDNETPKTIRIMANKDQNRLYSASPTTITLTEEEYNNKILAVLSKSGSLLTAYIYTIENKYVLTCDISSFGDISQIAPRLNFHTVTASAKMYCKRHLNTLVCPYAVSPETVATWHSLDAPFFDPREQIDAAAKTIHMYQSDINGHGHTVRDQYGNKAVFSGVDPDTGDRGYKVYDANGSDEAAFLGVRADGRRGLMMQDGDMTWLDSSGISGSKVMSLPWTSLDSATQLLFSEFFTGNFIMADENGEYGFNFGEGASQIKSYIFKATEDTYVNSLEYTAYNVVYSWRDVNYGSETRLRIANNAEHFTSTGARINYNEYAYIKFSGLSSIPASEEIVDAELRLYFTNLSTTNFMLEAPTATWSETTITWNNQPGFTPYGVPFDAKLGTTIIKSLLASLLNFIRASGGENYGFRIRALDESRGESVLYSREGHSSLCPTLVVYTRETQTPIPGLNLHISGGRVFLNHKIFDVPGKTLTLDANRNDITLYVYENEDGEAVIDFAHGGRAFKADSYVVLGSAKTSSSAITETSKKRNTGRKEGPRGMGNDVYSFGYPGDEKDAVDISTVIRTPVITHNLGGNKHQIKLEIKPAGLSNWLTFEPVAYADGNNKKGTTLAITSDTLSLIAGTDSIYRYIDSVGSPVDVTSAKIRGIIVRLD